MPKEPYKPGVPWKEALEWVELEYVILQARYDGLSFQEIAELTELSAEECTDIAVKTLDRRRFGYYLKIWVTLEKGMEDTQSVLQFFPAFAGVTPIWCKRLDLKIGKLSPHKRGDRTIPKAKDHKPFALGIASWGKKRTPCGIVDIMLCDCRQKAAVSCL